MSCKVGVGEEMGKVGFFSSPASGEKPLSLRVNFPYYNKTIKILISHSRNIYFMPTMCQAVWEAVKLQRWETHQFLASRSHL